MKTRNLLSIAILLVIFIPSCDLLNNQNETGSAGLTCKVTYMNGTISMDSLFFAEDDIWWFDTTTNQLKLKTTPVVKGLQSFRNFTFYLGPDSLFTARLALDIMSSIEDDLVLHHNSEDGNLYLEDGYPMWINHHGSISRRTQNKEKRAANWKRFIERLEKTGKLKV
ncbi:MAG: hypothetical protein LLF95_05230 [Bacteroidales bacterium]|nr:hypothetical protein [Bacteroidales bacterium]